MVCLFSPDDAYKKVTWQLTGGDTLQASNPTPYFITFSTVSVGQGAQKVSSTQGEWPHRFLLSLSDLSRRFLRQEKWNGRW